MAKQAVGHYLDDMLIDTRHTLKFNSSPGRGQRAFTSLPLPDSVMYASRMPGPPKQMFVVSTSGKATCS